MRRLLGFAAIGLLVAMLVGAGHGHERVHGNDRKDAGAERETVGKLSLVVGHFEDGTSVEQLIVEDETSGDAIIVEGLEEFVRPGSKVKLRGRMTGATLRVTGQPELLEGPAVLDGVAATPSGPRQAIAIIVDFEDASVPCTTQEIVSQLFTGPESMDHYYQSTSYGTVSFPGDSNDVKRITIPFPATAATESPWPCPYRTWSDSADSILIANDPSITQAVLDSYDHRMYMLPNFAAQGEPYSPCGTAWGELLCDDDCRSWNFECESRGHNSHEMGHNLNMRHASTDLNNNGFDSQNEPETDSVYGDNSDLMASSWSHIPGADLRENNAPHKYQMQWINEIDHPLAIVDIVGPGTQTFTIAPLEHNPATATMPQILRVYNAVDANWYYFSYRRPINYDVELLPEYVDVTSVHAWDDSGTIPESTYLVGLIGDFQYFADLEIGLWVQQLGHDVDSATLAVSLDSPPPCVDEDLDLVCAPPFGNDCDDSDFNAYPGAPELCDSLDNDCDGEIDEGECTQAPCPLDLAATGTPDEADLLAALYGFRDQVLTNRDIGERYIQLYYRHAPEALRLILTDPDLLSRTRTVLDEHVGSIERLLRDGSTEISHVQLDAVTELLDRWAAKAGIEMRSDIRAVQSEIRNPAILQELSIRTFSRAERRTPRHRTRGAEAAPRNGSR